MPRPPSTPKGRHRRQGSNPQTPSSEKQRLNGLLKDGLVYCNCDPRAEARLFETKKEGPNKGRWFYRCGRSAKFKCDLFLWESEAVDREKGLTPEQKRDADKEAVVHGPMKTPKSQPAPRMTQKSLSNYGYTKQRRDSDETESGTSDSEGGAKRGEAVNAGKGKRKLDVFEESDFGSLNSEDEEELAAMADETVERVEKTPKQTKVVAGLPTPSTTRTLFPDAQERAAKRHRTLAFDDLPDTPSKPSNSSTRASTKTVSFSSPPETSPSNPIDAMLSILAPYSLSPSDTDKLKNLLEVETRKRVGAEKSRDFKQKRTEQLDSRVAKLQEELAASRNKERVQHGQITEMRAKVMRHYQDFGNI